MPESTMPIEVHADVAKSFAKEYVEAVITDAMKILPSFQHRQRLNAHFMCDTKTTGRSFI